MKARRGAARAWLSLFIEAQFCENCGLFGGKDQNLVPPISVSQTDVYDGQ